MNTHSLTEFQNPPAEDETVALVPFVAADVDNTDTGPDGEDPIDAQDHDTVEIDPTAAWATWPEPQIITTNLHALGLGFEATEVPADETPDGEPRTDYDVFFTLGEGELEPERIGQATTPGLRLLSWQQGVNYPVDFVEKLSPPLRVQVVNERIHVAKDRELSVIVEQGEITNVMAGWRGVAPYKEVAQTAFNTLRDVYGDAFLEGEAVRNAEGMHLRVMTPIEEEVTTRKVGDTLQMGVDIRQKYGTSIDVALYVKRLVCLNGMMADEQAFQWTQKATGTVEHQLQWLKMAMADALAAYENLVERARQMAETPVNGDPHLVLEAHARAMRLPKNLYGRLQAMFDEEPEATEWGMLNAFTRLATHGGIGPVASRNLMFGAGQWTAEFDMVNARLPRPIAMSLGAELVS